MASLTSATGTISSAGIGSGLDVDSIVKSLMNVERQPLARLQSTATLLQTKLSAFGQMKSIASALQDAAKPLFSADSFQLTTASSSDSAAVSAGTTTKAVPGIYSVSVATLSASQSVVSASGQFADASAVVGTGSLTIRLGSWNAGQTAFTAKAGSVDITVPIGASESTLAGLRDKINAAAAGVSATVVTDSSGSRLALQSTATGAANGFRVTVADSDGGHTDSAGLSRLAFDPAGGPSPMTLSQAAADARATINGIAVSSSGNTLDNVIDGITFSLGKVTSQPVSVNVTRNTDAIKARVAAFVAAYNSFNGFLASATRYDAAAKEGALLQGDGTTTGIQNQLHGLVSQGSSASSVFGTMSSLGIQVQKDGSLKIDDARFGAAMANLPELTKALATVAPGGTGGAGSSGDGIGKRFAAWTDKLLASNGSIPGKTSALQSQLTSNQKSQDKFSDRLVDAEKRLRAQYTTLDTTMSKANALASYIKQQFYFKPAGSNDS